MPLSVKIAARNSPLSRSQVAEVAAALSAPCTPIYTETHGDLDQSRSLRDLGKTDFFTREVDALVLEKKADVAVHSAKDLPASIPEGLQVIALTPGIDSSDSLVLREGETLFAGARIGVSSLGREKRACSLYKGLIFVDIRGTIEKRLEKLQRKEVDGVVIAEAALIRLGLTHLSRLRLPGPSTPLQGRLAIIARVGDAQMEALFAPLRKKILYLGLDPSRYGLPGEEVTHTPVIETFPLSFKVQKEFTHVLFTSRSGVDYFLHHYPQGLFGKQVLALGEATAARLKELGYPPQAIAPAAHAEGVVELLRSIDWTGMSLLYPHSALSRLVIESFLSSHGIDHQAIAIYSTRARRVNLLSFDLFDEVVFTSPSTVDALQGLLPAHEKCHAIGEITQKALNKSFGLAYGDKENKLQGVLHV